MENTTISAGQHNELEDRFLLFHLDDSLYGLPLTVVLEILNVQKITPLPKVAPYLKGIINMRGKIIPIVDLRLRLGMPERPYDDMTCIVILELHDTHVGLIVDNVSEVLLLPEAERTDPPHDSPYLASVANCKGEILMNLDCERLFADALKEAHPKTSQSET